MGRAIGIANAIGFRVGSKVNQADPAIAIIEDGNTVAWYDYQAADTITKDGSNAVSRWNDKLGSGHDLIQASGAKQPLATTSGLLFDGIDDSMQSIFAFSQPENIYIVVNIKRWAVNNYLLYATGGDNGRIYQAVTSPALYLRASSFIGPISPILNQYNIIRALLNGASSKFILNENTALTGDVGAGNLDGITICSSHLQLTGFMNAEVKEIILRKVVDAATDEAAIYAYLKKKYAL